MEDHCDACGYDARDTPLRDVVSRLRTVPAWFEDAAAAFDATELPRRRRDAEWSALEYLVHVRDLMAFHRWLIERSVDEHEPTIATPDPDAAIASLALDAIDVDAVLEQIDRRVDRLCSTVGGLEAGAERRRLRLVPEPGVIDVALVVRSALHEAVHHRQDLARLAGRTETT